MHQQCRIWIGWEGWAAGADMAGAGVGWGGGYAPTIKNIWVFNTKRYEYRLKFLVVSDDRRIILMLLWIFPAFFIIHIHKVSEFREFRPNKISPLFVLSKRSLLIKIFYQKWRILPKRFTSRPNNEWGHRNRVLSDFTALKVPWKFLLD